MLYGKGIATVGGKGLEFTTDYAGSAADVEHLVDMKVRELRETMHSTEPASVRYGVYDEHTFISISGLMIPGGA